jgi:hypothetical protein
MASNKKQLKVQSYRIPPTYINNKQIITTVYHIPSSHTDITHKAVRVCHMPQLEATVRTVFNTVSYSTSYTQNTHPNVAVSNPIIYTHKFHTIGIFRPNDFLPSDIHNIHILL